MKAIHSPDKQNFKQFGKIIHYPNSEKKGNRRNLWRIVHTETAKVGWRIAYLVLRDKTIGRMGMHPVSDETFEPVKGRALLFAAEDKDLKSIKCFKLDKPILLYKGIWHNVLTLTPEAHIKICENAYVAQEVWHLGFRFRSIKDIEARING